MRILTLGAGTVGTWIADLLCQNHHSVTVVDSDAGKVKRINDELDVRAIQGSASQSSVLFQADVIGCDICLAVTGDDEVNLVAASMAKAMGARRTIARVYAPVFRDLSTFDYQRHFHIDRLLSLEHLTASELARNIRNPGSVVVEHFARGQLEVKEVTVSPNSATLGREVKALGLPSSVKIGTINREGRMWLAGAADALSAGDRITLIGRRDDVESLVPQFQKKPTPRQRVVIAGGGETGYHLARALETEMFTVQLMEQDPQRCETLANNLNDKVVTVVNVDATRRNVLEEERVRNADVFVACTGDDENNIMACIEARDIGAHKIMAIVGRPDYASVLGRLGIDLAVSERDVMAHQVLSYVNPGALISRTSLPGGTIDVLEIEVAEGAACSEHVLANLRLPTKCLVAAVMRHDFIRVPGADDKLQAGDTAVVLVEREQAETALRQFQIGG